MKHINSLIVIVMGFFLGFIVREIGLVYSLLIYLIFVISVFTNYYIGYMDGRDKNEVDKPPEPETMGGYPISRNKEKPIEIKPEQLKDGQQCSHPCCASHLTHPCEVCGRIGARNVLPEQKAKTIDEVFTKYEKFFSSQLAREQMQIEIKNSVKSVVPEERSYDENDYGFNLCRGEVVKNINEIIGGDIIE